MNRFDEAVRHADGVTVAKSCQIASRHEGATVTPQEQDADTWGGRDGLDRRQESICQCRVDRIQRIGAIECKARHRL
ncbi:hypothetical protein GCM10027419_45910 [Pandoraea terrae]